MSRPITILAAALILGAILAPGASAQGRAPHVPALGNLGVHVVAPGESLFGIARRYGLRTDALAGLNGLRPTGILLPGQSLWVPLASARNARAAEPAAGPPSAAVAAVAGAASPGGATTYTVAPGDTLYGLGRRFGVDIETLRRWNGLPADGSLRAGDRLVVAGGASESAAPAAPPLVPQGGQAATADTTYTVQPGDTLSGIARQFGASVAGLASRNGLAADQIAVGQVLHVPRPGQGPVGLTGTKRIEVDVSEQRMAVWQGDSLVWNFVVSTGLAGYPTRRGTFAVQSKIPDAWSSAWGLSMPNWLGIYWAGASENGIHALPVINGERLWAGFLGTPISYGCIVLGIDDAARLYDWADIGTTVVIRD